MHNRKLFGIFLRNFFNSLKDCAGYPLPLFQSVMEGGISA